MQSLKKLDSKLTQYSAHYKVISAIHLNKLQQEIEELNRKGKINSEIYNSYVSPFQYISSESDCSVRSVIVIAIPQRISLVIFKPNGKIVKTIIPPTYLYRKVRKACIDILSEVFGNNIEIKRALLPLKLLAVRSGLGRYGKNHLCYIDGMGSFARLEAFYIPYQADRDDWQHKELLHHCENCSKCLINCPTQCIEIEELKNEELIIDTGRCITFFNENEREFLSGLHPRAHNSLVGCIKCQVVCPVNRSFLREKTVIETFSEEETDLILKNRLNKSKAILEKLKRHDMNEYQNVLQRNLKVLIRQGL